MSEPKEIQIKVRPIAKKTEKGKLPGKLERGYPARLNAVFAAASVIESLQAFAASDQSYELGGVLVGRVGKASRRIFTEIRDFIPAHKGISRRASFEFTNEAQQEIHEIMQSQFKDLRIVGWFHTHPGYGIFLSSADQFIDEHYFKEKYHIAIVIDPTRNPVETGLFVWDQDQRRVRVPLHPLD